MSDTDSFVNFVVESTPRAGSPEQTEAPKSESAGGSFTQCGLTSQGEASQRGPMTQHEGPQRGPLPPHEASQHAPQHEPFLQQEEAQRGSLPLQNTLSQRVLPPRNDGLVQQQPPRNDGLVQQQPANNPVEPDENTPASAAFDHLPIPSSLLHNLEDQAASGGSFPDLMNEASVNRNLVNSVRNHSALSDLDEGLETDAPRLFVDEGSVFHGE